MSTDMTIARNILEQLGGSRFIQMTGATNISGGERELTFHLKARITRRRGQIMRITLEANDTYHLELMKIVDFECQTLESRSGVYVENLKDIFTEMTGLYTALAA